VAVKPLRVYGSSIVLALSPTATPSVTLDSSGNLGLGVTPSAWGSSYKALQVGYAALSNPTATYDSLNLTANLWYDGTNWRFIETQQANRLSTLDGVWTWEYATGSSGAIAGLSTQMTLDASGNLGIGTNNPGYKLDVQGTTPAIRLKTAGVGTGFKIEQSNATGDVELNVIDGYPLIFKTTNTERARITSGGYFKASNTGTYGDSAALYHELVTSNADDIARIRNSHASTPYGIDMFFSGAAPDNNTQYFLLCRDNAGGSTNRCIIYSDGDLANHDGVYGTISDQKLKQDIVDAGSQWDDIKAIRFRKYRMKSDVAANPDAPALLGVIAQELEQVSPGLVDEHPDKDADGNDLGTATKTVKSSILLMKAAVALQEAMARIEKLEAEVAALKGV
jgi:hypothetical protein